MEWLYEAKQGKEKHINKISINYTHRNPYRPIRSQRKYICLPVYSFILRIKSYPRKQYLGNPNFIFVLKLLMLHKKDFNY